MSERENLTEKKIACTMDECAWINIDISKTKNIDIKRRVSGKTLIRYTLSQHI
jgi:hypothetical protein